MSGIDDLIGASVDKVKTDKVVESGAITGVVASVGTDGTISVTRGSSTFPKVRCLSGYPSPKAGDTVQMLSTTGGWVAIGSLATQADTGWVNMSLASGVTAFSSAATEGEATPSVRRIGKVVYLRGRWSFSTSYTAGTDRAICTVPTGFWPTSAVDLACAVTGVSGGYTGKAWFDLNNKSTNPQGAGVIHFWCGAVTSWGGFAATSWTID